MPTVLEQYRVADFLEWQQQNRLELNPNFQRGSVWLPQAKSFLIDTILRELPIPKIYLRTRIDVRSRQTVREVVDGQQRLRSIIDFSNDKFPLMKRAGEFAGKRYSDLAEDEKERFLGYSIAVDQLVNASDENVLEVFARLNSYSVALNAPEKRHAQYQGEFKWAVREASQRWAVLWERYNILSVRERLRMQDDSLMAEMLGVLLQGVGDGGQPKIDALYRKYDGAKDLPPDLVQKLDRVLDYFVQNLAEYLLDSPVLRSPHFLMLFAALAHRIVGVPPGEINPMPDLAEDSLKDLDVVRGNLLTLGAYIQGEGVVGRYEDFYLSSTSTTHRISSRKVRFPVFVRALSSTPI
ncbi:DUF262 domain-containing protein [Stenotrophomonas sp. NPDC078853]|uniref:DUF262 domain-containing protein n=1 Tax=Stenotrophomonas sp. NPDC078853 TaxID=3364534 RepID=UPI0038517877